ncbi:MAG: polyprenol monophosphomannose synthase [Acidimicrobiia bacterium]|nr:polyprenol monophosphomannose synthase [Acidimicrobiia bacterium]MBT8217340.1 polyprenol monophosphomannose synthase [Acidimicrobiia bacterium]NNF10204.1 polyprenol monophosphomannose synthase [Acidimicrobiia bacterium]NNL71613.1 polyprenol monophosphomannose synthase [Acidimicrobiia bacterium]
MRPEAVAVVVPTYNESENLTPLIRDIRALGYQVLIVDDNSPDGTGALADQIADGDAGVSVLHRSRKEGLGPAYAAGFAEVLTGGAEIVCQMDADFSHDPASLPDLVQAVAGGSGAALGSRYVPGGSVPGWPLHRRLLSRLGNGYARRALATDISDMTSGFRAYRSEVLAALQPATCEASGYGFQVEMARRCHEQGVAVAEVPITFRDRRRGESKMNWRIAVEAMWLVTLWGVQRLVRR